MENLRPSQSIQTAFYLKHKNNTVLEFLLDSHMHVLEIVKVYDKKMIPLFLQEYHVPLTAMLLDDWISARCIPENRQGIDRVLPKLGVYSTRMMITKWFFVSLTDQYWITPVMAEVLWEDINLFQNNFSDSFGNVLIGNTQKLNSVKTPDASLGGQLKKKWKIINNIRTLIKDGSGESKQEVFNEVIATEICKRMHFKHVTYRILKEKSDNIYCACDCFVDQNTEFVSAYDILGTIKNDTNLSQYEHYIKELEKNQIKDARKQVEDMLLLDFIIGNIDRHLNNFGILRDADTLEFLETAPIFDTGSSLGSNKVAAFFDIEKNEEINSFESDEFTQFKLIQGHYDLTPLLNICEWIEKFLLSYKYVYPEKTQKILKFIKYRIDYATSFFNKVKEI